MYTSVAFESISLRILKYTQSSFCTPTPFQTSHTAFKLVRMASKPKKKAKKDPNLSQLGMVNGKIQVPFHLIGPKFHRRSASLDAAKKNPSQEETLATEKQIQETFTTMTKDYRKQNFERVIEGAQYE